MTHLAFTLALSTALACAAFGAVAGSAMAGGVPSRDSYTVNVSPTSVQKDSSTTFDFAMANTSTPGRTIGAAAITPPLGFRVTGASLPVGAKGHVYVWFNVVLLDHLSVAPGSTLDIAVTATAPSRCNTPFNRWFTVATGGLFGELMFPDPSSSLTTNVTCANPAAGLKFVSQPSNSTVNQDITPAVTVDVVDSGGTLVNSSAPVTIALGTNGGNGNLTGTLTENAVNGVATFSDLQIDQPGFGYTLAASSGALSGATSDPFSESNSTSTDCSTVTPGDQCTTDLGTSVSNLAISADPSAGTINESVDVGSPLVCPNQRISFDSNTYGFSETGTADKTLTYELFGLNGDQTPEVEICFGAPYEFVNSEGGEAASGTLPDGSPGFVDLLPNCDDEFEGIGPCFDTPEPFTDGHSGLSVTVHVPGALATGAPADPSMHG
ncbi:MAG TPA: hypothetical protein VMA96_07005 [Solirubrobacteraceae bacterium]|nr:hypothetical protein [Solirubrobacteraceae bacterium]